MVKTILVPERARKIAGSFAFIEHRFLREGFLGALTPFEAALYLFLVLAADRYGLSYYSFDRICSILRLDIDQYVEARNALIERDLIAFDGHLFQVLSLPSVPKCRPLLQTREDMERGDAATIQSICTHVFGGKP